MQAYFVSKSDLKVKCVCMPTSWELYEDSLSAAVSSAKFAEAPNASVGDFIAFKDGGLLLYLGVLSSVEGEKGTSAVSVRALPVSSLFSRNILLGTATDNIEEYIENAINENFVSSGDALLDTTYINVSRSTETMTDVTPHNDNGIYNLETHLRYVAKRHAVFVDFKLTADALEVTLEQRTPKTHNIDATVSDVLFVNEVVTAECVSKVLVKTASSVLTFYAFDDGSYGASPAAGVRVNGRAEAVYCENADDALKAAGDVFANNLYNHLIETEIAAHSKLIGVSGLRLFDKARVKTKSGVYDTYISAISRKNTDKVTVKFGDVRLMLTDKMKRG